MNFHNKYTQTKNQGLRKPVKLPKTGVKLTFQRLNFRNSCLLC